MPFCALTPFDVTKYDMARLDPGGAVDLIRDLIHLEASCSGIKASAIDVPADIYSNDGGIDGVVKDAPNDGIHGIVKQGTTMYQVKSGKFSPNESCVRDILFNKSKLKDGIRACFEEGGTLVVAFTGWDAPTAQHERAEKEFHRQIEKAGFRDPLIEIWHQNQIIGFLKFFPARQLAVKGLSGSPLYLHEKWHSMANMMTQVHLGEKQRRFIDSMRAALRGGDRTPIRVSGEPGIGKTRLVLEATDADDLRPAIVYFERPRDLTEHDFMSYVCGADLPIEAILVVDECELSDHASIWNKLKYNAPGVRLVTIFIEESRSGQTLHMPAPPLADSELEKIIKGYVADPDIRRWSICCRPSPGAAHVIGLNLKYNPDDLLRPPDEVDVWGRYVAGKETSQNKIAKQRTILLWLSLFRKFGFESPHGDEADRIAKIVECAEGIPRGEFMGTVRDLRKSKILRGSTTLYITPIPLHLYLRREWCKRYPATRFPQGPDLSLQVRVNSAHDNLFNLCLGMFTHANLNSQAEVSSEFRSPGAHMESDTPPDDFLGSGFLVFRRHATDT